MKCLIGVHLKTLLSIWNHLKASPFHPTMTSGEGTSTSLSTSSQVAAFCDSSDDDFLGIDLMNLDFTVSSALSDWNVNKNEKSKDIPCKFHDGFSGSCWKGSNCPYGHETFSGEKFAQGILNKHDNFSSQN